MVRKTIIAASLLGLFCFASHAQADPVEGPQYSVDRVDAFSTFSYNVRVWGGETTAFQIRGDGDTDLDIYVYDEAGRLVAKGEGYSDRETVTVTPGRTQTLRVVVKNLGSVYNEFRIDAW